MYDDGISSESAESYQPAEPDFHFLSDGNAIAIEAMPVTEPEVPRSRARSRSRAAEAEDNEPRDAKTGPPSLDEWTRFFGNVILRAIEHYYINIATRGIDEDVFSERELERLELSDHERKQIVVPFAELSSKSKFMRKHGRTIVASGDAINSVMIIGMWMSRVNRIAAKHRPRVRNPDERMNGHHERSGQGSPSPGYANGASGGHLPEGYSGSVYIPGTG